MAVLLLLLNQSDINCSYTIATKLLVFLLLLIRRYTIAVMSLVLLILLVRRHTPRSNVVSMVNAKSEFDQCKCGRQR
jgi:hypothetical protein